MKQLAIGVLDSGIGGFSVVKELKRLLPKENIEYFADHARQPYGPKGQEEIEGFVVQIINFLLEKGIKACVIACNTATSKAYHKEIKRINPEIEIFANPCPKFTPLVESGLLETTETYQAAKEYLKPIKDAQIDTLILGCTHYPFLQKVISEIMGPRIRLVNPAYNAVLDLKKILKENNLLKIDKNRKESYYTSGSPDNMKKVARAILNSFEYSVEKVIF